MAEKFDANSAVSRVERLMRTATHVLGSRQSAATWFRTPEVAFGWRRPIDLIWTAEGIRNVETLLERMEHGVYT
jgi:putative toxin-antitoxin system antitoxin component (TIGR02293 family)